MKITIAGEGEVWYIRSGRMDAWKEVTERSLRHKVQHNGNIDWMLATDLTDEERASQNHVHLVTLNGRTFRVTIDLYN